MNRFEAIGLAVTAGRGHRVLVIFPRMDNIPGAVESVAKQANDLYDDVTVQFSHGHEAVKVNTGEVRFTFRKSARHEFYEADAVFLVDSWTANQAVRDAADEIVAARGGQVVFR